MNLSFGFAASQGAEDRRQRPSEQINSRPQVLIFSVMVNLSVKQGPGNKCLSFCKIHGSIATTQYSQISQSREVGGNLPAPDLRTKE